MKNSGDVAEHDHSVGDEVAPTEEVVPSTRPRDAYARIRVAILSGELDAGRAYSQATLSRDLGVGRTPLREAIRRLQTEGLLESEPNRKIRVAPLDLSDLTQLYALRISVEALATRLAVPHLSDDDLRELANTLAAHEAAWRDGKVDLAEELHQRFHFDLTRYAGARVHATVVELADHADRYRRQYYRNPAIAVAHFQIAAPEHELILEAAQNRDAELCARLVAQHLARIVVTLAASVDGSYGTEEIQTALKMILD